MKDMMDEVPESVRSVDDGEGDPEQYSPSKGHRTVYINCYDDGMYDVFEGIAVSASEGEYPNGIFGLESIEEALKAVIAIKRQGKDYAEAEDEAMLSAFGGREEEA